MFSYCDLNKDKMVRLRNEFGVCGTDTGRMCMAALNRDNMDYVCESIAKVVLFSSHLGLQPPQIVRKQLLNR